MSIRPRYVLKHFVRSSISPTPWIVIPAFTGEHKHKLDIPFKDTRSACLEQILHDYSMPDMGQDELANHSAH